MPRIELSDVQRGFFDSAKSNVQTALDTAAGMERQATQMHREAEALLKQATKTRTDSLAYMDDVMLKIGAEHGCKIPRGGDAHDAQLEVVDGRMVFTWGEPQTPIERAIEDLQSEESIPTNEIEESTPEVNA